MLMFPGFETAIRTRSGEEGEAAASGKVQPQSNGPTSSIRGTAPATRNHRKGRTTREDTEESKDNKKGQELLIVPITSC